MKKYHLLLLLGLLILASACSNLAEQEIKFEDWNINIKLPGKYKNYSYKELTELTDSVDEQEASVIIGAYLMQFMYNKEMQILVDSTSFYNIIALAGYEGSIYIKPEFIKPAGNLTTLKLTQMYKKVGGDVEPIEGAVKDGKHYRYMKLKYKLSFNGKEFFYSYYIIRLKEKMIGVAVINEIDEDFEDSISEVAIYNLKGTPE